VALYLVLNQVSLFLARLRPSQVERFADSLTAIVFDWLRIRRGLIMKNLRIAFGKEKSEGELEAIGRASVYNFFLTIFEFLRSVKIDIARDVSIEGDEHIKGALAKGQGVYILCMHLGNWEAMGAAVSRQICPAYVLVKKVGGASVNRFVDELREKNKFYTVKRKSRGDGFRAIKDTLARGEIIGFVMDQARPGEPRVPFFGAPAKTNTSLAAIWRRAEAPIVPAYIERFGIGKHRVTFLPEVTLVKTADESADVLSHTQKFNEVVERCVTRRPEQYFWMHDRWK
jgi:Kdo2-lipid IVA lauroyltransferase/acyltransferase